MITSNGKKKKNENELTESGVLSTPGPTCSQAAVPLSKLRNAWVSSSGSYTMRFFSSS